MTITNLQGPTGTYTTSIHFGTEAYCVLAEPEAQFVVKEVKRLMKTVDHQEVSGHRNE